LKVTSELNIGVTLGFPGQLEVEHPSFVSPGSTTSASLTLSNSGTIIATFYYNLSCSIEFSYWFIQINTTYFNAGEFVVDFDTSTIVSVLDAVGLGEYVAEDISLGIGSLTLESLVISPKFIGTILTAVLSLDVWFILEIVVHTLYPVYAKSILKILDYLIDEFLLTATITLESHVTSSIESDHADFTPSDLDFREDAMTIDVEVTFSEDLSGVDKVEITITDLSYVLDLTVDWAYLMIFDFPINLWIYGISWSVGTYPSLSGELLKSTGGDFRSFNVDVKSTETTSTPTTALPIQLLPMFVAVVVWVHIKRRN